MLYRVGRLKFWLIKTSNIFHNDRFITTQSTRLHKWNWCQLWVDQFQIQISGKKRSGPWSSESVASCECLFTRNFNPKESSITGYFTASLLQHPSRLSLSEKLVKFKSNMLMSCQLFEFYYFSQECFCLLIFHCAPLHAVVLLGTFIYFKMMRAPPDGSCIVGYQCTNKDCLLFFPSWIMLTRHKNHNTLKKTQCAQKKFAKVMY